MLNMRILAVWLLALLAFVSALGVVLVKHESRRLFVDLQRLEQARDDLNVNWGRLQLEQSTLGSQGRIESIARERLAMEMLRHEDIVLVTP